MNTQKYGWPVIIAASLHGALFLISSEPEVREGDPPDNPVAVTLWPATEQPFPEEADEADTDPGKPDSSGAPEPLRLPEVLQETTGRESITVEVTIPVSSPYKVSTLENFTDLPAGPGTGHGPIGRPRLIGVEQLDRVPQAVVRRSPAYPEQERRNGIDGSVTVEFVVGIDGRVIRAEAVKWSRREFVEPAVRAVQDWRFEPGTVDGRKVSFRMAVPIEFSATP